MDKVEGKASIVADSSGVVDNDLMATLMAKNMASNLKHDESVGNKSTKRAIKRKLERMHKKGKTHGKGYSSSNKMVIELPDWLADILNWIKRIFS